jgi:hypothetical protein
MTRISIVVGLLGISLIGNAIQYYAQKEVSKEWTQAFKILTNVLHKNGVVLDEFDLIALRDIAKYYDPPSSKEN